MFGRRRIRALEKSVELIIEESTEQRARIKFLEEEVERLGRKIESRKSVDKPDEGEITAAQLMDEWLNGRKEGGK